MVFCMLYVLYYLSLNSNLAHIDYCDLLNDEVYDNILITYYIAETSLVLAISKI